MKIHFLYALFLVITVASTGCERDTPYNPSAFNQIAYSFRGEITTITKKGSRRFQLTHNDQFYLNYSPDWHPDGTKIVFSRHDRHGLSGNFISKELYTINPDGTEFTQITNSPNIDEEAPKYSPDGKQIVYHSNYKLYVINADGSNNVQLTADGPYTATFPDWSPDGTKIIFSRSRYNSSPTVSELYTINPDGTGLTQITNSPSIPKYAPKYSPDGTQVVYHSEYDRQYQSHLYTTNIDGSNNVQLTNNNSYQNTYPSWSPDGTKIIFSRHGGYGTPDGVDGLYTINDNGTRLFQITEDFSSGHGYPTWK